ncbi:hypothetical protein AVEN_34585-1, partial [Araneus ventricosus]
MRLSISRQTPWSRFTAINPRSIASCMICLHLSKSSEITSRLFISLGCVTDSVLMPLLTATLNELKVRIENASYGGEMDYSMDVVRVSKESDIGK